MKLSEMFPSRYLKVSDLGEGDLNLTISGVEIEQVGQDQEERPVVYFKETDKALVLNKTNANTIGRLHGDDSEEWTGKRVTLFESQVSFKGEEVACVRVRLKSPKNPKTPESPDFKTDDIPF